MRLAFLAFALFFVCAVRGGDLRDEEDLSYDESSLEGDVASPPVADVINSVLEDKKEEDNTEPPSSLDTPSLGRAFGVKKASPPPPRATQRTTTTTRRRVVATTTTTTRRASVVTTTTQKPVVVGNDDGRPDVLRGNGVVLFSSQQLQQQASRNALKSVRNDRRPPLRRGAVGPSSATQQRSSGDVDAQRSVSIAPAPTTYIVLSLVPLMVAVVLLSIVLIALRHEKMSVSGGATLKTMLVVGIVVATAIVSLTVALALYVGPGVTSSSSSMTVSPNVASPTGRSQSFGGNANDNAALEALSYRLAAIMDGDIVVKPGVPSCYGPVECGGDNKNHYGLFFSSFCGYSRHTACVSGGASTKNAVRGSAMLHEVMHMYERRLQETGKGPDVTAITGGTITGNNYYDEPLTDCLTMVMGGKWLYYGCAEPRASWARTMIQRFPPAEYPWAPPLGQPAPEMAPQAPNPPAQGSRIVPISPVRVFDSRNDLTKMPLGAGMYHTLQVAGVSGIDSDATGAILNVVVVDAVGSGFLTVYPNSGPNPPLASVQNYKAGDTVAGAVVSKLANNAVNIYSLARVHIVVDISAFQSTRRGDLFLPVAPSRLYDSRNSGGRLQQGEQRTIDLRGKIPDQASAVCMTASAINAGADGFLTLYPGACQANAPVVSTLNYKAGQSVSNYAIMPVQNGLICAYAFRAFDLTLDVTGYLTPSQGSLFFPIMPQRLVDTRAGGEAVQSGIKGRLNPGQVLTIPMSGSAAPAQATAVALSVTAVDTSGAGYIAAYPCDTPYANTVSVLYGAADVRPDPVFVGLSAAKTVCLISSASTDVVVDLSGFFQ